MKKLFSEIPYRLFFCFLSISFVVELGIWVVLGGGSMGYSFPPVPYVVHYFPWIIKHVLFTLGVTLFYTKIYQYWENPKGRRFNLGFFIIGTLYLFTTGIGHGGDAFCGSECSDFEGFSYFIWGPMGMVLLPVIFSVILFPSIKKIELNSLYKRLVICVAGVIIVFFVLQPIYSNYLGSKIFFDQTGLDWPADEGNFSGMTDKFSEKEWFNICLQYRFASLGLGVLGNHEADQCYQVGAVHFEREEYCKEYSARQKECRVAINKLKTVEMVNGVPESRIYWKNGSNHVLIIRNLTNGTIDTTGFTIVFSGLRVATLPPLTIGPKQEKEIPVAIPDGEMIRFYNMHALVRENGFALLNKDGGLIARLEPNGIGRMLASKYVSCGNETCFHVHQIYDFVYAYDWDSPKSISSYVVVGKDGRTTLASSSQGLVLYKLGTSFVGVSVVQIPLLPEEMSGLIISTDSNSPGQNAIVSGNTYRFLSASSSCSGPQCLSYYLGNLGRSERTELSLSNNGFIGTPHFIGWVLSGGDSINKMDKYRVYNEGGNCEQPPRMTFSKVVATVEKKIPDHSVGGRWEVTWDKGADRIGDPFSEQCVWAVDAFTPYPGKSYVGEIYDETMFYLNDRTGELVEGAKSGPSFSKH